jgi:hypothetical protein
VIVSRVVNDKGRAFNVRVIRKGDCYGLNDCLVHDKDELLVEFWDATYERDPRFTPGLGQFVSRYFLGTLTERQSSRGIALCGHVPEWTVTGDNVADATAAAEAALTTERT